MPALRDVVYAVRVYLAGAESNHWVFDNLDYKPFVLESFANVNDNTKNMIPRYGDFLLDSGAFTFMQGKGGSPDWDEYVERYADYIKRNNVEKFFELDIDSVVGYERVLSLRRKLEHLVGKPSIPVWHLSRGMAEFKKSADEYDYIAIGGIVSGEIKPEKYAAFPAMIQEAHKRGAKIHGLGFTNTGLLKQKHFDSVDSTTWLVGARFGNICVLRSDWTIVQKHLDGKRCVKQKQLLKYNFDVWIKYQKWALTHL